MLCVFVRAAKNTTIAWLSGIEKLATYGLRRLCVETQTLIIDFCVVLIATDAFVDLIWSGFCSETVRAKGEATGTGARKAGWRGLPGVNCSTCSYVVRITGRIVTTRLLDTGKSSHVTQGFIQWRHSFMFWLTAVRCHAGTCIAYATVQVGVLMCRGKPHNRVL